MNRKLQALVDEFSRDLQARLPGTTLEVSPRHRKSAYIHINASDESVWDIVEQMAEKQIDTLIKTGYSIVLLPHVRAHAPAMAAPVALREKPPDWTGGKTRRQGDEESEGCEAP
jgi:hypothetical protein